MPWSPVINLPALALSVQSLFIHPFHGLETKPLDADAGKALAEMMEWQEKWRGGNEAEKAVLAEKLDGGKIALRTMLNAGAK